MNILCFGIARDIVQGSNFEIVAEEQPRTVAELRAWLSERYPEFQKLKHYMVAINQEYAQDEMPLHSSDEIVIIPPVSGG